MLTHTLGFPRVGLRRELKKTLESYWKGEVKESILLACARNLRLRHWELQKKQGIDLIPVNDFSLYDHVLDTTVMLGAVPERFGSHHEHVDLATYFRMARGEGSIAALEMSKWFDTNYHYLVPEFSPKQRFRVSSTKLIDEVREAVGLGIRPKPVLLGPVTYLKLGKSTVEGFDRFEHLDAILSVYETVLRELQGAIEWLQIDEPALVLDLTDGEKAAYRHAFERLNKAAGTTKIILATYFESLRENAALAASLATAAVHVDLVRGPEQISQIAPRLGASQKLSLGLVDGRNIWRVDADAAWSAIEAAKIALGSERLMLGTSCSLLHVPTDLDAEEGLDPEVRSWMSFAKQKCEELRLLADVADGRKALAALDENRAIQQARRSSLRAVNPAVRARLESITDQMSARKTTHAERKRLQQERLHLPLLPTTTIGSFPQTAEVRKARLEFKRGQMDRQAYVQAMESFIRDSVEHQHALGLDVLVHGEAERNDMVEYFGEQLDGFCFTQNGWVQSYGSRCVKPPIIFGDVSRPKPMTVEWAKYAQSLTDKPMKGMLTGPVTILCWSFVRDDQPRSDTCKQIALAIRDEVQDLEQAGIAIIQVDEAALREGLPLRRADWNEYLEWAVYCFRLSTSGIRDETQLHTHMCYSEFNDIVQWIAKMDADVVSIEASRSKMELLKAFRQFDYPNDIGPGIYDIHSPRVPSTGEMTELLQQALDVIPDERLWVNPDCGLKTRGWPEVLESLRNMVDAAQAQREVVTA
ncbi:MAG TPA: 5-methyltetrahydropteroyltriglutamate--homocysteine S-methyltransferase [Pirellulales bacterium]|jgi:5-methyltetrahydropteroyltriglutamate--homocysteine methyltransferase